MLKKKIIIEENSEKHENIKKFTLPTGTMDIIDTSDNEEEYESESEENDELSDVEEEPQSVIIKSKRGRKPKQVDANLSEKIQKKRGRKPKPKNDSIIKNPKKRGRKPKERTYSILQQPVDTIESIPIDPNLFIIQFKMTSDDVRDIIEKKRMGMKGNQTSNYQASNMESSIQYINKGDNNMKDNLIALLNSICSGLDRNHIINKDIIIPKAADMQFNMIENKSYTYMNRISKNDDTQSESGIKMSFLMGSAMGLINNKDFNKWPESSSYACWNCSECFNGMPIGIPEKIDMVSIDDVKFYLYGNFCNFACASRYLFDNEMDDSLWEKYGYLNLLYIKLNDDSNNIKKVMLAPKRILLNKFGGPLSIEEYRMSAKNEFNYKVYKPPMISIYYQAEELSQHQNGRNDKFVPLNKDSIKSSEKDIKSKPYNKNINTIDKCLSVKVSKMFSIHQ